MDLCFLLSIIFSKINISLAIFIPPAVENAVPPMSINTINKILSVIDSRDKSINWKPVIVAAALTK